MSEQRKIAIQLRINFVLTLILSWGCEHIHVNIVV